MNHHEGIDSVCSLAPSDKGRANLPVCLRCLIEERGTVWRDCNDAKPRSGAELPPYFVFQNSLRDTFLYFL